MNLLVTGAWADAQAHIPELTALGHTVLFLQQEKDPLPCDPAWVQGVVCNGLFLHHPIEAFSNLRFIQLTSAGYDRVALDYVKAHGIELYNAAGVYSIPMAEFAVGGVLQLYKQSRFFWGNQKQHRWEKHRGLLELSGKTVCIVGCGNVGRECARRFAAFGCRVIGVNRTARTVEGISALLPLEEALPQSHVVVLTIALTEDTRHLMNGERFAMLREGAVLVNISRGAVVDEKALQAWLESSRSGGAVLDVFEEEPLPEDSPLWDSEKVLLSPHNSFVGDGVKERLTACIIENLTGVSIRG